MQRLSPTLTTLTYAIRELSHSGTMTYFFSGGFRNGQICYEWHHIDSTLQSHHQSTHATGCKVPEYWEMQQLQVCEMYFLTHLQTTARIIGPILRTSKMSLRTLKDTSVIHGIERGSELTTRMINQINFMCQASVGVWDQIDNEWWYSCRHLTVSPWQWSNTDDYKCQNN